VIRDAAIEQELRQVLWACFEYWKNEVGASPQEQLICYSWVRDLYLERFGADFHQSKLGALEALGLLAKQESSRGGHRAYYRLVNPSQAHELLRGWQLV